MAELSDIATRLGETFGHEPCEVHTSSGPTGRMCCGNCFVDWPCAVVRKIERAMVPTVRAIVADELRAAADEDSVSTRGLVGPGLADLRVVKTGDLHDRADEMDPR